MTTVETIDRLIELGFYAPTGNWIRSPTLDAMEWKAFTTHNHGQGLGRILVHVYRTVDGEAATARDIAIKNERNKEAVEKAEEVAEWNALKYCP